MLSNSPALTTTGELTGYLKIPPPVHIDRQEQDERLRATLAAIRCQNSSAINQQISRGDSSDLNGFVKKLLSQVSGEALQAFWEGSVLNSAEITEKLDVQTHTAAMSILNR
jgi:hypothetical protein